MSTPRYDLRSATATSSSVTRSSGSERDSYRYGWRIGTRQEPGGRERTHFVPLTYQDLLNPQLGDKMTQDSLHIELVALLTSLLKRHFAPNPEVGVFSDLKVIFEVPDLPGPAPDVFVVRGVRDRDRRRKSFREGKEPGRIVLVIEVVSPDYKEKDYEDLPEIYEKAGVGEYVTVEALGDYLSGPYELAGRRMGDDLRYHEIPPDTDGRIQLESVGLWLAPDPDGWGLEIADRATGRRVLTPEEERLALEARLARLESELERRSKGS